MKRSGSSHADSDLAPETPPPAQKRTRRSRSEALAPTELLHLNADVLRLIPPLLGFRELCNLGSCNRIFRELTSQNGVWQALYESRFNGHHPATPRQRRAAELAGSWKSLFTCKMMMSRELEALAPGDVPWERPCKYELDVALEGLTAVSGPEAPALSLVFLVDGSGSVTEEDFTTMTNFMSTAVDCIAASHPDAKVAVVQFSNDVRVELPLEPLDRSAFHTLMGSLARMNGGTSIASAIQKAGQLLKTVDRAAQPAAPGDGVDAIDDDGPAAAVEAAEAGPGHHDDNIGHEPVEEATQAAGDDVAAACACAACIVPTARVLVLLTDGRVDSYQAREAVAMTQRLADEQANVSLFAFGVGRGVDKAELVRIIGAACPKEAAESRYTGLMVLDEAPW